MKYSKTTKPRYRFKAIKWTKLEEKPRHTITMKWADLKNATRILSYSSSAVHNGLGIAFMGGQKPRPRQTI